jgi:hypothetical protein
MNAEQLLLDLFGPPPNAAHLYTVRGYYFGPGGYQERPDGQGNYVEYANRTRLQILGQYATTAELDEMVATGERRHTSGACSDWSYEFAIQPGRRYWDPVNREWVDQAVRGAV